MVCDIALTVKAKIPWVASLLFVNVFLLLAPPPPHTHTQSKDTQTRWSGRLNAYICLVLIRWWTGHLPPCHLRLLGWCPSSCEKSVGIRRWICESSQPPSSRLFNNFSIISSVDSQDYLQPPCAHQESHKWCWFWLADYTFSLLPFFQSPWLLLCHCKKVSNHCHQSIYIQHEATEEGLTQQMKFSTAP